MTPQGWYPDPTDRASMRWWDGQRWTVHTRPGTSPAGVEPTAPAPIRPVPPRPENRPAGTLPAVHSAPAVTREESVPAAPRPQRPIPRVAPGLPTSLRPATDVAENPTALAAGRLLPPVAGEPGRVRTRPGVRETNAVADGFSKASYRARIGAWFVDVIVLAAPGVSAVFVQRVLLGMFGHRTPYGPVLHGWPVILNLLVLVGSIGGTLGLFFWNLFVRQGRTGQTLGKQKLGLRLVDVRTGQPVGALKVTLRHLAAGLLAVTTFGVGALADLLWPIRNRVGQRLIDKALSCVVVPV